VPSEILGEKNSLVSKIFRAALLAESLLAVSFTLAYLTTKYIRCGTFGYWALTEELKYIPVQ
jgi:hypothetical protein